MELLSEVQRRYGRKGESEAGEKSKLFYYDTAEDNKVDKVLGCDSEKTMFRDFEANARGIGKPLARALTALQMSF